MKNIVLPICCLLLNSCTTKFQNDITNLIEDAKEKGGRSQSR